ncbi:MAG TPA: efflux RND transporter periplasmic adaptor subunit [Terriglobales bacterium]
MRSKVKAATSLKRVCRKNRDPRLTISSHSSLFSSMLILALTGLLAGCGEKQAPPPPQPPDVQIAPVVQQDVPIYATSVAQLNGPVNADITPKVQGYLLKQDYANGSFVKTGQLLFQIDPRPFEASLDQAKADVERAMAALEKANNDVQRDTPLAAQNAIPQKQLDDDIANQAAGNAQVAAAKAQQQQAELNLGWTKVNSPVDGIAGVANSQIGDLVGTATKMTVVSKIDPIWAYFNISEATYLKFAPEISKAIQGAPGGRKPGSIEYIQANDVPYPYKGEIIFVSREIAAGTGTIQMAAAFPNKDAILRPGGFGMVRFVAETSKNALLIPQAAVIEVQSLYQTIVVSSDNKATVRMIKVGDRVGQNWVVTDGLKAGEQVVVEGAQRVQTFAAQVPEMAEEGVPVNPKPYTASAAGGN